MPQDKEIHTGRSIQTIRLDIRRQALALESDRRRLRRALREIDELIDELAPKASDIAVAQSEAHNAS